METFAHRYYRDQVIPAFEDWREDEAAIHNANSLAVNLTHLADHYFKSYRDQPELVLHACSLKEFKDRLAENCPEYGLMRDVADAHNTLKRVALLAIARRSNLRGVQGWRIQMG